MKLENPILLGKYARLLDKAKQNKKKERARKRAILLSSNKNQEPFQWPRIFNYGLEAAPFLANNSIYTTPKRKTVLRRNKRNRLPDTREWIKRREYDENHLSNVFESSSKNDMLEDAKDQVLEHAFDSVIEEIKPVDSDDSQKTDTLAVRHLAFDMVEQLFQNMSNTYEKQRKKDYDWEYVLGKAIETGLPAPVIERVRQRMTRMTKKESQAIVALNTPKRDEFVDLTEPVAEAEIKRVVLDISSFQECPLLNQDEPDDVDQRRDIFESYIALTQDNEHLSSRAQTIHDYYNQQVFKTESRFDF